VRVLLGNLVESLKEETVGELHDVGLVGAGNTAGTLAVGSVKGVTVNLERSRTGDKTTALNNIAGLGVLDTSVGVLNVFTNKSEVNLSIFVVLCTDKDEIVSKISLPYQHDSVKEAKKKKSHRNAGAREDGVNTRQSGENTLVGKGVPHCFVRIAHRMEKYRVNSRNG
jgi:hypothetical protein